MPRTEFAGQLSNVRAAYESFARRVGVPIETVVQYVEEGRSLNDLFDYETRKSEREEIGQAIGANPHRALGHLNALQFIWAAQESNRIGS